VAAGIDQSTGVTRRATRVAGIDRVGTRVGPMRAHVCRAQTSESVVCGRKSTCRSSIDVVMGLAGISQSGISRWRECGKGAALPKGGAVGDGVAEWERGGCGCVQWGNGQIGYAGGRER
jgi:hypothetical protein